MSPSRLWRRVTRFIQHWKPDVGIFVESELWPNLVDSSSANGVKLCLVNARISTSSAKMWNAPVANCLFRETVGATVLTFTRPKS